ncbi:MAG: helix-hairpin-helix domain-containing protein [Deltaproteobacteria bacterium]|nr:helix-hairpin-helix domain-containing protein [Deltaproteobacteria bacterium]MBW2047904.1 helix-hairpin-helix domain-containing protein [Deltaproteobacteria bacterium]MBW2352063.1 helix-hairpin-helix domain-containing protein [Deltaproteobacteria bacterium]HDZ91308.1 helix-hairpin-helix domain-containing protein [Deltaproteobacteria bacterium]
MKKRSLHDRFASAGTGGLVLLLLLITLHLLKGWGTPGRQDGLSASEAFVQVSGDIRFPGVYGFHDPPTLKELVTRAGGLIFAQGTPGFPAVPPLKSGVHVKIRRAREGISVRVGQMSGYYRVSLGIPLPLNSEGAEGLAAVPGISSRIAVAIVRERHRRGGFKRLTDIRSVPGIGPVLYRRIRPYLALDTGSHL